MANRIARMGIVLAAAVLGGCRMPSAGLELLDGLDEALGNVASGQQVLREAVIAQTDGQQAALDAAFEADMRNLAALGGAPANAAEGAQAEPTVKLADVLDAKRLYDARRVELEATRAGLGLTFDRLDNNLAASRQMVDMLRRLTLQQHLLAGQAEIAVNNLLQRQAEGPAAGP